MGSHKRFTGDYTITSIDGGAVNINVPQTTINGNLTVVGTSSQVWTNNSAVFNNFIVLNQGYVGDPVLNSGLLVNRGGSAANVVLQYSETFGAWQVTNDGFIYANIVTEISGGQVLTSSNVSIEVNEDSPLPIDDWTRLYAQAPRAGASGLYVTTPTYPAEELIIKTKALIYTVLL